MSWLSKQLKSVEKRVIRPTVHFVGGGVKDVGDFMVNAYTFGIVDPKWGSERFSKAGRVTGIATGAVLAGWGLSSMFAGPTAIKGAAAAETVATEGLTGMELEAAAGSAVAWAEPATGAATEVSGGIFTSIGAGLKSVSESLGLAAVGSKLFSASQAAQSAVEKEVSTFIDKQVSSMFGGSGEAGGSEERTGSGRGGLSMLPIVLIVLTLIGAYVMTRKKRRIIS